MASDTKVVLYRVGNNLNRAYRTCEFFGVLRMQLCQCNANLSGNLFKAKDRVELEQIQELPTGNDVAYFETDGTINLNDCDLSQFNTLVFGGESYDLPKNKEVKRIKIPRIGEVSGLTVEAALAIVLYKKTNP